MVMDGPSIKGKASKLRLLFFDELLDSTLPLDIDLGGDLW